MNRRFIAAFVGTLAVAAAAWIYLTHAQRAKPAPAASAAVVPITDGKTIDFSSGRATVKNDGANQATMDAALKDMDSATKDVTFKSDPPKK